MLVFLACAQHIPISELDLKQTEYYLTTLLFKKAY